MASPYPCMGALALYYSVTREEADGRVVLVGPEQVAFLRSMVRLCADGDTSAVFGGARRRLAAGTLFVNGHPGVPSPDHARQCSEALARAVHAKAREPDKFVHDALHVAAKLVRLLRFALLNPHRPLGTVRLHFPKSGAVLARLAAATRFFERTESEADRKLLKGLFGVAGLRDVCRAGVVFGFESRGGVHMLTPYAVVTLPKPEATVDDVRLMVAQETA